MIAVKPSTHAVCGLLMSATLIGPAAAQTPVSAPTTVPAPPTDPVVNALRRSEADAGRRLLNPFCQLLQNAYGSRRATASERQTLIAEIAGKLRERHPDMLYARGDAALLGLYGLAKNRQDALRFYTLAAGAKSPEAGYNAALLLYRHSGPQPQPALAQRMLKLLQKSTAIDYNVKGIVASQAHFLAAQIYERGLTGQKDLGKAFLHYRTSARNGYVPGIERYLRMLLGSVAGLSEAERTPHVQEMRTLASRWKWSSPEIMRLTGDLYVAGWIPDDDGGFYAQYHWRIAARMEQADNPQASVGAYQERIQPMADAVRERRLEDAVNAALKQHPARPATHALEFVNACS